MQQTPTLLAKSKQFDVQTDFQKFVAQHGQELLRK